MADATDRKVQSLILVELQDLKVELSKVAETLETLTTEIESRIVPLEQQIAVLMRVN